MKYETDHSTLKIYMAGDLNYKAILEIKEVLKDEKMIVIYAQKSKLIDSEAIIFLFNLMESGKKIQLNKAPDILKECLRALELEKIWLKHPAIEITYNK